MRGRRAMGQMVRTITGARTVINARWIQDRIDDGAEIIVPPGLTNSLGNAALDADIRFLPGITNAGDNMRELDPVLCVGESWLVNDDHADIQQKASAASCFG